MTTAVMVGVVVVVVMMVVNAPRVMGGMFIS